jgi:hypothetical protein
MHDQRHYHWHMTAEQKIAALAAVLRGAPREERRTQLEERDDADVDRDGGAR